jgi:hypothetical protein
MSTALTIPDYLSEVYAEIAHIWTDDLLPYFARFGAWGVAITKNILFDLKGVVLNGVQLIEQLTGAALKQLWQTIIEQVKAQVGSGDSFAVKVQKIRDILFSTVNWGSIEQMAVQIGYTTLTSMITGFLAMAMAGTL